jgi:hypothetical protein
MCNAWNDNGFFDARFARFSKERGFVMAQKMDKIKVDMDRQGNQLEPMMAQEIRTRSDFALVVFGVAALFILGGLLGGRIGYQIGQQSALVKAVEAKR